MFIDHIALLIHAFGWITSWLSLNMKLAGVMVVLVHLDILFILENCSLDWWKAHGVGKYIIFQLVGHILLQSRNQVCYWDLSLE